MHLRKLVAIGMVAGVVLAGCGGGSAYDDLLSGLKSAAFSKATYNAVRNSDDLAASEKAVVNAFCKVSKELVDGEETLYEEAFFERVTVDANEDLGELASPAVDAAVGQARSLYDFVEISPALAYGYVRACYG